MFYGDLSEGFHVTTILPKLRQHDVVHHKKVGVNKAAGILQNSHVH